MGERRCPNPGAASLVRSRSAALRRVLPAVSPRAPPCAVRRHREAPARVHPGRRHHSVDCDAVTSSTRALVCCNSTCSPTEISDRGRRREVEACSEHREIQSLVPNLRSVPIARTKRQHGCVGECWRRCCSSARAAFRALRPGNRARKQPCGDRRWRRVVSESLAEPRCSKELR